MRRSRACVASPPYRGWAGSSSINGLVFVRGQAQAFAHWAQLGNKGWSYADVLPFYKKLESYGIDLYEVGAVSSTPIKDIDPSKLVDTLEKLDARLEAIEKGESK